MNKSEMNYAITLRQIYSAVPYIDNLEDGAGNPFEEGFQRIKAACESNANLSKVSIGDVVISSGWSYALWCIHLLGARERVSLLLPAVKRAAVRTAATSVFQCLESIERWLRGEADYNDVAAGGYAILEDTRIGAIAADDVAAEAVRKLAVYADEGTEDGSGVLTEDVVKMALAAVGEFSLANGADLSEERVQPVIADILAVSPPLALKAA